MRLVGVLIAGLLLVGSLLGAQEGSTTAPRVAAIYLDALGSRDELIEEIVVTTLGAQLEDSGLQIYPQTLLAEAASGDAADAPAEARIEELLASVDPVGVDVIAAVFYLIDGEQLILQYTLYDPAVDTVLGGVLTRARTGATIFTGVEDAALEFEPAIARYVAGRYQVETPPGIVERIIVRGPQEGSTVYIISALAGTISGGRLLVPYTQYEQGDTVPVSVQKSGYHAVSKEVLLTQSEMEIDLPPLVPQTRFDAGLRWSFGMASGIGFDARIHLQPDVSVVGIEQYRLVQRSESAEVRHYDVLAKWSRYLFSPPGSLLGFSVGAGLGVIVSDVDGVPGREYLDLYLVIGDPTVELRLGKFALFGRVDFFRYALGVGYNLLGRTWLRTPYGIPPITGGVRVSW